MKNKDKNGIKKSKIKIPYIRLNFRIVRQADVRWCGRSVDKIIIYLLPDYKKMESVAIMMECYNDIVFDRFV